MVIETKLHLQLTERDTSAMVGNPYRGWGPDYDTPTCYRCVVRMLLFYRRSTGSVC